MSGNFEFKLVVIKDGQEVLSKPLSYESVCNIVANANDGVENLDLFALAALHPASKVREEVLWKDHLPDETVKILTADKSINVQRNLVRSKKFKESATIDVLEKLLALDTEVAQYIAEGIESFSEVDTSKLAALVASHPDTAVVASLAGNYSTPKKILKSLLNHADPDVVSKAKIALG